MYILNDKLERNYRLKTKENSKYIYMYFFFQNTYFALVRISVEKEMAYLYGMIWEEFNKGIIIIRV